jgi:hypothetical protein
MTVVEILRKKALESMKAKDSVSTTILRLAQSEVQALEAKTDGPFTDEAAFGVLRKLIKSNEETLAMSSSNPEKSAVLQREIEILKELLPKGLSTDDIIAALAPVLDAVKAAGNDGQATGVAMKHLKSAGAQVTGNDVSAAVKKIRA